MTLTNQIINHIFCVLFIRINLKINPELAAKIMALRPGLESLIVKATNDPESIAEPSEQDSELMATVRAMSKPSAGKFGVAEVQGEGCVYNGNLSYFQWSFGLQ